MGRFSLGGVVAAAVWCGGISLFAAPATTEVMWQADETGNPSGVWTDANHWAGGAVPGALKFAKFNLNTNYEVRVEGDVVTQASFWLMPNYRRMVRFNGRGATFTQPSTTSANYSDSPFALRIQHPSSATAFYHLFNVYCSSVFTNAVSRLEDFDLSVGYTNGEWRADFDHGTFNFANPEGNTPKWATTSYQTLFEYGFPGDKQGIYLHAGSSVTLGTLHFQGSAKQSLFRVDGGTHSIEGYVYAPIQSSYLATDRTVSTILATGSGSTLNINGSTFIGQSSRTPAYNPSKRVYRYVADDKAALNVNGYLDHYYSDFYIGAESGATTTVTKAINLAKYAAQTGTLYAVDATLNFPSTQNGNDALTFGVAGEVDGIGRLLLTNSVMYCNPNILFYHGYGYTTNSTLTAKHVFRLGNDPDYETTLTFDDSTVSASETIAVGYSTGKGRLVLKNGTTLNAYSISSPSGLGTFLADGAVLSPTGARAAFFGGLASAEIGPGGFTIDADYDVTIAQSFTETVEAEGAGHLVLSGSGKMTMTGDLSGISYVEVTEGVADLTGRTIASRSRAMPFSVR